MARSLRILIIDDDAHDAALATTVLTAGAPQVEVRHVGNALQFAEELVGGRFEAALVEARVGWAEGLDVLDTIKRAGRERAVLLFASALPAELLSEAMRRGLDGYLVKNSRGFLSLPETLQGAVARVGRSQARAETDVLSLLERAQVGVFRCTLDGSLLAASPTLATLLGAETGRGANVFLRCLPEPRRAELLARLQREGFLSADDLPISTVEGRRFHASLRAVLGSDDGVPIVVGTLERQPERAATTAAPKPSPSPPAALAGEALVTAHDLKEPLRTLVRYSELLRDRQGDALGTEASEYVAFIHEAARRMQDRVGKLFGKPAPETLADEPDVTDTGVILSRAVENLRAALDAAGGQVTSERLPTLRIDPDDLLHLFQNLVENAVKFRGEDPPWVHVVARREENGWRFVVEDNGIGVEADEAERIFTMFHRGRTAQALPGTGIGLAVCRRIVEKYGGRIWAEPRKLGGTAFCFTLRVEAVRTAESTPSPREATPLPRRIKAV